VFLSQLAQAFHSASEGSDDLNLRLLEMLAVGLHNLAIKMFKQCHPRGCPHEENMGPGIVPALEHPQYGNCPQYPNGSAEMVGYFAETMVFGLSTWGLLIIGRQSHATFLRTRNRNRDP
jgi:hypothetical protein